MKSVASAPGKVILFGEHAVVYGVPAIAAALSDLRLFVTLTETDESSLKVSFEDILDQDGQPTIGEVSLKKVQELVGDFCEDVKISVKPDEETSQRLKDEFSHLPSSAGQGMVAITYLVGHILQPLLKSGLAISVKSHGLPIGAGLGSSAAFSVASSAACLNLRDKLEFVNKGGIEEQHSLSLVVENLHTINSWAFMAEVLIHGTPSGLDNTTSTYGGMIKFKKLESSNEYETFTNIPNNLKILLTNTKVPRSTKQLVSSVRELYNTHISIVQSIFHSIEEITNQFIHILQRNDKKELSEKEIIDRVSELISINHHLLCSIGVGHPALTTVVEASKEFFCAGKLTGAGGGGCAITLVREEAKISDLVDRLRSFNYDVFESTIGGEGVRIH